MKKEIKALLKRINSEIILLIIEKANMVLTKPKNLTYDDEKDRAFNSELWGIEKKLHDLRCQKRTLMNLIGTL